MFLVAISDAFYCAKSVPVIYFNFLLYFRTNHQEFELRCEDEKKKRDMKIILELDQKVMDQQSTLEKAGVPGFTVTNNSQEIRLQMYLLDFIIRLSQMDYTQT